MNKEKEMQIDYFKSAIGLLRIGVIEGELVSLVFVNEKCESAEETPCSKLVKKQLKEYFKGKRLQFVVPMSVHGTPFQERVWAELQRIPFGETRSYQQIAEAVGSPKAVRAVGNANNRNPICIIIPCHRVIGKNQQLVGYAGGIVRKQALLEYERDVIES
ncbi:methylated-DNA--[protein]-cysteine S-methyltransferase [Dielma fastidiosa]|uniref:methylated-DNA--[protein]-cysteine S-methyltransferase n=1 Tax=Dielma fastidiosa TaxID=1034346 RepID=UPI0023EF571F|nr:methylated-DNA--[protein]-cysteine S-methyltransferase [Dielma fastidiosa]